MSWLDWAVLVIPLVLMGGIVRFAHRYTHSVVDFLSAGRCGERYMLAVASNSGAIVFAAIFEQISQSGFALSWWSYITPIFGLLLGIYGFVTYRLRETRVLTLAQFFEIRYSKSFRVFAGVLGAVAGLACDGIIAAVEARFFVYFLGLPGSFTIGPVTIDTYLPVMALFLFIAACVALGGGFVAIMLIDCIEGMMSQMFFLVLIVVLLSMFSWTEIATVLGNRPPGKSMVNPFDTGNVQGFNIWFVLMTIFANVYRAGAWRHNNGNDTAPLTAHEGRMGMLLSRWRDMTKNEVVLLLAICGLTFLSHPHFAEQARTAHAEISRISPGRIQGQMMIPVAIGHFLPTALKDIFCILLLMQMACGTGNRSQSWAGIIIQDIVVPLRRKPIPPERHLFLLKLSILGVMLYFFLFGALFRQTQYIAMWFNAGAAIFLGGAGSVIIGGLYWKKGTTAAAWAAMTAAFVFSVAGIVAEEIYPWFPDGMELAFYASILAIVVYPVVSLATCRKNFDMDRMLHRGKYEVIKERTGEATRQYANRSAFLRLIGVDDDFSPGDKWIAGGLFGWTLFWLLVFIVGTVWNLVSPWPKSAWLSYWHVTAIGIPVTITVVTAIWFTWGGARDIYRFSRRLRKEKPNVLDNGMVIGHQNAVDLVLEQPRPVAAETRSL